MLSKPQYLYRPINDRFFLLGGLALLLCSTFFMSILAPFPLALAFVIYGRAKGFALFSVGLVLAYTLSRYVVLNPYVVVMFLMSGLFAAILAEIVFRGIDPVKGLFVSGATLLLLAIVLGMSIVALKVPVKTMAMEQFAQFAQQVDEKNDEFFSKGEEQRELLNLIKNPEAMWKETVKLIPNYLLKGIFVGLWINLFLLLRSVRLFRQEMAYPFTEKSLIRFKVPEIWIWPFIAVLGMTLFLDKLPNELAKIGIQTALTGFGIFYFFQGFGIYVDMLDWLKVRGFVRSFLIVFTVFTMAWMLALLGLFDLWVNFRKFFKPRNVKE